MTCNRLIWAAVAVGFFQSATARAEGGAIDWTSSFRDAKDIATNQNRLMMLDFYTDW